MLSIRGMLCNSSFLQLQSALFHYFQQEFLNNWLLKCYTVCVLHVQTYLNIVHKLWTSWKWFAVMGRLCVSPDFLSFPTCVSLDWSVRDLLACQDAVVACRPAFFTNSVTGFSTGKKKHVCSIFSLLLCVFVFDSGSKTSVQEYSDSNVLKGVCLMGFAGKSWQRQEQDRDSEPG